jgi:lycopene beta-cyclase
VSLDTDIAIIGGGCAGLSLAVALAELAPHLSVQILEERTDYVRDRTWCYWNTERHPFESCVSHSWDRWRVSLGDRHVLQQSDRYRYQHIPADRFYGFALKKIQHSPRQQLTTGVLVQSAGRELETSAGSIRARWTFDSRPVRHQSPGLVQRFVGWHIRTELACFNSTTVELMDFQHSEMDGRAVFFYTLPFSEHDALVEVTYLERPSLPRADAEFELRRRLEELTHGGWYEVLFREQASLPMTCSLSGEANTEGVVRIGTPAGRVKPSSGYAFLRIQRQCRAIARALAAGTPVPKLFEPRFYGALDKVFLEVLEEKVSSAPAYFLPLFERVPADNLIRFLSECGNMEEAVPVILALPQWQFIKAVLRHIPVRLFLFGLCVGMVCIAPAQESHGLLIAIIAGICIAMWHGAYDGVLAKPVFAPRLGRLWLAGFAAGYLLLAGAVMLLWWAAPALALLLFLLYSAWHFGTEVDFESLSPMSALTALSIGGLPILAACRWHVAEVSSLFATMLGNGTQKVFAQSVAMAAAQLLPAGLLIAVCGVGAGFRGKAWSTRIELLVLIALEMVLFRLCNPVLAFGIFFCVWHTPEHLTSSARDADGRFSARVMWQQLRSGIAPWVASLCLLGLMIGLGPRNLIAYESAIFIFLSALTVPHMALNEIRRGEYRLASTLRLS